MALNVDTMMGDQCWESQSIVHCWSEIRNHKQIELVYWRRCLFDSIAAIETRDECWRFEVWCTAKRRLLLSSEHMLNCWRCQHGNANVQRLMTPMRRGSANDFSSCQFSLCKGTATNHNAEGLNPSFGYVWPIWFCCRLMCRKTWVQEVSVVDETYWWDDR